MIVLLLYPILASCVSAAPLGYPRSFNDVQMMMDLTDLLPMIMLLSRNQEISIEIEEFESADDMESDQELVNWTDAMNRLCYLVQNYESYTVEEKLIEIEELTEIFENIKTIIDRKSKPITPEQQTKDEDWLPLAILRTIMETEDFDVPDFPSNPPFPKSFDDELELSIQSIFIDPDSTFQVPEPSFELPSSSSIPEDEKNDKNILVPDIVATTLEPIHKRRSIKRPAELSTESYNENRMVIPEPRNDRTTTEPMEPHTTVKTASSHLELPKSELLEPTSTTTKTPKLEDPEFHLLDSFTSKLDLRSAAELENKEPEKEEEGTPSLWERFLTLIGFGSPAKETKDKTYDFYRLNTA